jgi:hypothetical protein
LKVIDPIAVKTENPEPVTVTEMPFGPWVGVSVMVGVLTVNAADETTVEPVYVITKYDPAAVPPGTVTVAAAGIAPATLDVKLEVEPATQETVAALVLRQSLYRIEGL